jgi:hypothetical protein
MQAKQEHFVILACQNMKEIDEREIIIIFLFSAMYPVNYGW